MTMMNLNSFAQGFSGWLRRTGRSLGVFSACLVSMALSAATLSVNPPSWLAPNTGGNLNVAVASDVTWTVTSSQSWLTSSLGSGSGNRTVVLTVAPNPNNDARAGAVTFKATGVADQIVSIAQPAVSSGLWAFGANGWNWWNESYWSSAGGQLGNGTDNGNVFNPKESLSSEVAAVSAGGAHSLILKTNGSLWGCGLNSRGQLGGGGDHTGTPRQILASGIKSFSAGSAHSMVVKTDGSLWGCGNNVDGQLGNNSNTDQPELTVIYATTPKVASVSAGVDHTLIVKEDGSLWACGRNNYGQLGDGTKIDRNQFVPVVNMGSGVASASAGNEFSLVVKTDGSLWGFGKNDNGQLGNGTKDTKYAPIQIMSPGSVVAVSAGGWHSLILKKDGSLWSCGRGDNGRLGDGSWTTQLAPVQIVGPGQVALMSAGYESSLVVKNDGSLWACGKNNCGQLGDGAGVDRGSLIPIITSGVASASAGKGGCYSYYSYSRRQVDFNNGYSLVVAHPGVGLAVTPVSLSFSKEEGSQDVIVSACNQQWAVSCPEAWIQLSKQGGTNNGSVSVKALKNRTIVERTAVVTFTRVGTDLQRTVVVTQAAGDPELAASPLNWLAFGDGDFKTVTVTSNTSWTVKSNAAWLTMEPVSGTGNGTIKVVAATNTSGLIRAGEVTFSADGCASPVMRVTQTMMPMPKGSVWGFGANASGQLGDQTSVDRLIPWPTGISNVRQISAGNNHTVIVKNDDSLWVFGNNTYGQLGISGGNRSEPVQVLSSGVKSASAGGDHTLVVKKDGTLWACGRNDFGQLGNNNTANQFSLVQVSISGTVASASAGNDHSLILRADGTLWACGRNNVGQLGTGDWTDSPLPKSSVMTVPDPLAGGTATKVVPVSDVAFISAGNDHSLFIKSDKILYAFGNNEKGQLGDGKTTKLFSGVQILTDVTSVSAGYKFSLAVKSGGSLWAWGSNDSGQFGNSSTGNNVNPLQVLDSGVVQAMAGSSHSLVLKTDGSLWSCGNNGNGRLGIGTTSASLALVPVQLMVKDVVEAACAGGSHSMAVVAGSAIYPVKWLVEKEGGSRDLSLAFPSAWTASSDSAWLKLSRTSGTGAVKVTMTAEANTEVDDRVAIITIVSESEKGFPRTVVVTQRGAGEILSIAPSSIFTGMNGESKDIAVTSNVLWSVSCNQPWVFLSANTGSRNGSVTVTMLTNDTGVDRSAVVTFTGATATATVNITQRGIDPVLEIDPVSWNVVSSGGTQEIKVTGNIPWRIVADSWIVPSVTEGTGNATVKLTVGANPQAVTRTGSVLFISDFIRTVSVTQAAGSRTLILTPSTWTAPKEAGAKAITVTSNVSWTASSNQAWLALDQTSGAGNSVVALTTLANPLNVTRSATVTFVGDGIASPKTVVVTQAAGDVALTLTPETAEMFQDGGTLAVGLDCNTTWSISSNQAWLFVDKASGSGASSLTLTIAQNNTGIVRTAILTVTAKTVTKTVTVTQQPFLQVLTVNPETWTVYREGGSTVVSVTNNTRWTVSSDQSWLTLNKASGTGDGSVTLSATPNATGQTRMAMVVFTGVGGMTKTLTVTQMPITPYLSVYPERWIPGNNVEAQLAVVTCNAPWIISADQPWITFTARSGSGNGASYMIVMSNPTGVPRTANVTVDMGGVKKTIVVSQGAMLVSPMSWAAPKGGGTWPVSVVTGLAWTVVPNVPWLTVAPASGIGSATVTLTAAGNGTMSSRKGTVTFTAGTQTQIVTVTQASMADKYEPNNVAAAATPNVFASIGGLQDATAAIYDATIHSLNTADYYQVNIVENGFLLVTLGNLPSDYRLYLYRYAPATQALSLIASNLTPGTAEKKLSKLLTPGNYLVRVAPAAGAMASESPYHLTLAWDYTPTLAVTPSAWGAPSNGGTREVSVVAGSLSWTASSNSPWLAVSQASGTGVAMVTLTASPNGATVTRTGLVTFVSGALRQTVKVTQVSMADKYEPNNTADTATDGLLVGVGGLANASAVVSDATIHTINTGDYYKFNVTTAGTLKATLDNLPSNYHAYLYSYNSAAAAWKLLVSTSTPGPVAKSFTKALEPGTYVIRVASGIGAVASPNPYCLTAEWTVAP